MLFQKKNCLFPAFDCPFFLPNSLSLVITAVLWLLLLSIDFGVTKQQALARRSIHENRTIRARVHLVTVWCRVAVVCCLSGVSIKKAPRSEALQNVGQFLHQACRRFKLLLLLTQLGQCVKGVDHVGEREREKRAKVSHSHVCAGARENCSVSLPLWNSACCFMLMFGVYNLVVI